MFALTEKTLSILIGLLALVSINCQSLYSSTTTTSPGNTSYPLKVTLFDHYAKSSREEIISHHNFNPVVGGNLNSMGCNKSTPGMVARYLNSEGVPVPGLSNECTFSSDLEKWFTGDENHLIEKERVIELKNDLIFAAHTNGSSRGFYHYINSNFYPLDNKSGTLVDMGIEQEIDGHNLGYTMHLQTWFVYESDEKNLMVHFTGGDDFWIFIDGQLVLDLGGMKDGSKQTMSVESLVGSGALNLFEGETYTMDIFFAKRHTSNTNFNLGIHEKMLNQGNPKKLIATQIIK